MSITTLIYILSFSHNVDICQFHKSSWHPFSPFIELLPKVGREEIEICDIRPISMRR